MRRRGAFLAIGALALALGGTVWGVLASRPTAAPDGSSISRSYVQNAQDLARQGRYTEALAALSKAEHADPQLALPYTMSADLLSRSQRFREALEQVREAHRRAPNDPAATLALLAYTPPYLPAAETEAIAREAVAQAPDDAQAYYYLGTAIANGNDPKRFGEALHAFEESRKRNPGQPLTLIEMGKLYCRMGDYPHSLAMLERAWLTLEAYRKDATTPWQALLKPSCTTAFWLAQVYRKMGNMAESRAMNATSVKLSAQSREMEMLQVRATASPPDLAARSRLAAMQDAFRNVQP